MHRQQVERQLQRMTLKERISLLSGHTPREELLAAVHQQSTLHYNEIPYRAGGLPGSGIPSLGFSDGPKGMVLGTGVATCYPAPCTRGASFDPDLEQRIGTAIAEELRANGANLYGGVCLNVPYHPGWGRAQEVYGEDPWLIGRMGAALVRGVQRRKVIACLKHYALNSMENMRLSVNITCSRRAEREVFLPQFRMGVEAGARAVMGAYNRCQGTWCCENDYLLRRVLRDEWGFEGITISDFTWGVHDGVTSLQSGLDIEMPFTQYYGDHLIRAVQDGTLDPTCVDAAARRVLQALAWCGDVQLSGVGLREADALRAHRRLALRSAEEGIILLKNEGAILPLDAVRRKGRIAVLGRQAKAQNTGDHGSSRVYPPYVVTPLEGLRQMLPQAGIVCYTGDDVTHCQRLVRDADAVLIFAGMDYRDEGECFGADPVTHAGGLSGDRVNGLRLSEEDLAVIRAVAAVRDDAVVILSGGSTILMEDWIDSVGALLISGYAGMEGGTAIAEILTGKVNPSGHLPYVIPRSEADLPEIDWSAEEQHYDYYHGYTLVDHNGSTPLFPFGYGLSYTTFAVRDARAEITEDDNGIKNADRPGRGDAAGVNGPVAEVPTTIRVTATVTNTGNRAGTALLQLYMGMEDSCVERPIRVLRDFSRVILRTGESREVTLRVRLADLAYYDEAAEQFVIEDCEYVAWIGTSEAAENLIRVDLGHIEGRAVRSPQIVATRRGNLTPARDTGCH